MLIKISDFIRESVNYDLVKDLKRSKQEHSLSVANLTKYLKNDEDIYTAALYHDYIERVGDTSNLSEIVSYRSYILIKLLSNSEDVKVYKHFSKIIKSISNKDIKESLLIIKLCDRIDNLNKRSNNGELTDKYIRKSHKLINFILKETKSMNIKFKMIKLLDKEVGDIIDF